MDQGMEWQPTVHVCVRACVFVCVSHKDKDTEDKKKK